jgi:hypothetical protein
MQAMNSKSILYNCQYEFASWRDNSKRAIKRMQNQSSGVIEVNVMKKSVR